MGRARRAGSAALALVVAASAVIPVGAPVRAAPVSWATSSLVISEVQTGGASASDEFVEVANQGSVPVGQN